MVVLAETAESPDEIDLKRAETAKDKAERALLAQEISLESIIKNQNKIRRSQVRIEVVKGSESKTTH